MEANHRVLIVEDDKDVQEALVRSLRRLGCETSVENTAEKGVESIKNNHFDAVLVSLCVREMGGRSVARMVRNISEDTKTFLVTGWKGDLESNLLRIEGIHDVIRKPLNFSTIKEKFNKHFGQNE
ncbi:response regulator [Chitinispirillales bacterium ANBcel5]|uniref:response regulator n=1 Tax=Cellulosispirillum alkaliphilum TaxID=3039283 RepID=UPI002A50D6F7|nr:response regulator [Chitinispirillales bacterium ANBcel5]